MSENTNLNSDENKELNLHDLLIKQHSLLLQQYETMAKLQQQKDEKDDEIDLTRLIPNFLRKSNVQKEKTVERNKSSEIHHKAKRGIALLINYFFKKLLQGAKRFVILIVLSFILAASYGVYVYKTADKVYSSTMTLDAGNLDNSFFSGLVDNLGILARTKSSSELAAKLNLTEEQAEKITNFEYNVYEDYSIELQKKTDSTEQILEYPFFTITVRVLDNDILPILNTHLFDYLNTNPYVEKNREVKRRILTESINKYDIQLGTIDSLKKAVIQRISKKSDNNKFWVKQSGAAGGGLILTQEEPMNMEPMTPFERALSIEKEQLKQKEQLLKLDTGFKIIDGLAAIPIPIFPSIKYIIAISLLGLIIGSIFAFIISFIFYPRKTKNEEKKK